jgi:hypothetical protein
VGLTCADDSKVAVERPDSTKAIERQQIQRFKMNLPNALESRQIDQILPRLPDS